MVFLYCHCVFYKLVVIYELIAVIDMWQRPVCFRITSERSISKHTLKRIWPSSYTPSWEPEVSHYKYFGFMQLLLRKCVISYTLATLRLKRYIVTLLHTISKLCAKSEVTQLHQTWGSIKHVLSFDISMNEIVVML